MQRLLVMATLLLNACGECGALCLDMIELDAEFTLGSASALKIEVCRNATCADGTYAMNSGGRYLWQHDHRDDTFEFEITTTDLDYSEPVARIQLLDRSLLTNRDIYTLGVRDVATGAVVVERAWSVTYRYYEFCGQKCLGLGEATPVAW